MKKHSSFFIILLLLISGTGKGQYYANIPTYPQTPEAASLSKFGDIPVGYYTGVPNIEIPLYTIEQDGVKIPISLQYHSSGIKVDEIASRVGLGWSLNTGGNISRKVYGSADKGLTPKLPENFRPSGSIGGTGQTFDQKSFEIAMQAIGQMDGALGYTVIQDLQPDIYSYNFLGDSGKFLFNPDGSVNKIIASDIKISTIGYNQHMYLTNISGVKAGFSALLKNEYEPYLEHPSLLTKGSIPNLWTPDEIILPNQSKIKYQYETGWKYDTFNGISETEKVGIYKLVGSLTQYVPYQYDYSSQRVTEKPVSRIIFDQGSVVFVYDTSERQDLPGDYCLKELKVFNNQNQLVKHYVFSYTYFLSPSLNYEGYTKAPGFLRTDATTAGLSKRLKLTSVKEVLSNSVYSFEYHEEKQLPARLSPNKDHWGLANGANNTSSLPKIKWMGRTYNSEGILEEMSPMLLGTANREPNFEYARLGTIKSITYPTGGKSEFTYELDTYYFNGQEIESETSHSLGVHNQQKQGSFTLTPDDWGVTFVFNNGKTGFEEAGVGKSYGVLLQENTQIARFYSNTSFSLSELVNRGLLGADYNQNKTYTIKVEPDHNLSEAGNWQEPQVRFTSTWLKTKYRQVTKNKEVGSLRVKEIKNYDTNGSLLAHKKYSYTDPDTGFSSAQKLELDPYYVGVVHQYNYNPAGITDYFVLRNTSVNELNIDGAKPVGYKKVTEAQVSSQNSYTSQFEYYVENSIYHPDNTYATLILPERVGLFNKYGNLLKEKRFNDQNKLVFEKENNYESRLYGASSSDVNYGTPIMLYSKSSIWSTTEYKFDFAQYMIYSSTWFRLLHEKTTEYFYEGSGVSSLSTVKKYSYSPDYKHLQPVSVSASTSTGGELITNYQYPSDLAGSDPLLQELQDQNRIGSPVVTEVRRRENGTEQSLAYSKIQYAKDASTSQLILPKFAYSKKGTSALEKKITYDKYDNQGNLLQYTMEDGLVVSVIWGYNGQYPIAKIEGATYTEVEPYAANLQNLSNTNNQSGLLSALSGLRSNLPQVMVTTYTYQPLVGVTSVTAPNGLTEYYTYDSAGRLQEIKDAEGKLLQAFEYHYKP